MKLFCIDLDGTTLIDSSTMHSKLIEASRKVKESGNKLVIATGRALCTAEYFYNELELDTPLITSNGAHILNMGKNNFVSKNVSMDSEFCKYIESKIDEYISNMYYYNLGKIYSARENDSLRKYIESRNQVIEVESITKFKNVNSIVATVIDGKMDDLISESKASFPHIRSRKWDVNGNSNIEFSSVSCDKWYAIKDVANYYNISEENIYTFGDEINDLMMISECINSYVVSNGNDDVKASSKNILQGTNLDGIVADKIIELI